MSYTNDPNIMDWNDSIENDGQEFVILNEDDYNYQVTGFERGRFHGSAKLPACNKAVLTLTVNLPDGRIATAHVDLILYRTLEWRISSFFRSIGHKKKGDRLPMDWNQVLGAKGRAHFKPRDYTDKAGNARQANDVVRFIDYDPAFFQNDGFVDVSDQEELPFES